MRVRTATTLGAMLVAAVTSTALATSTAYAGPPDGAAGPHCAYNADSAELACAGTPEQAREDVGSRSGYLVAQLWKDADYRGATLRYYRSRACTASLTDREIPVPVVPKGWNDRLSSVRTDLSIPGTRCSVRIYRHGRFTGASFTINHYTPNLGGFGWNDVASSWYIS
ncbi:peptidase inhibitor family I36 protein [Plantactinospora endophytica]|uniref:Uncharacterized protein n=1 Tax=Plantactinospora endophytica TaxID=673535 RepID=A0ABQ4DUS4_9ACTN|nr:peptidase inhibitor family I36 protein [Plantactinospora endophytica]GIG86204.1 hypothetical protein Pen02_11400 [Plantactinospora endophytica]